jgi:hypothetical protein
MGIQESRHICGAHVFPTLQKSPGKDWNRIGVCLYKVRKYIAELIFLLESGDSPLLIWEKGGQGMAVILVDLRHVRIRHDDKG